MTLDSNRSGVKLFNRTKARSRTESCAPRLRKGAVWSHGAEYLWQQQHPNVTLSHPENIEHVFPDTTQKWLPLRLQSNCYVFKGRRMQISYVFFPVKHDYCIHFRMSLISFRRKFFNTVCVESLFICLQLSEVSALLSLQLWSHLQWPPVVRAARCFSRARLAWSGWKMPASFPFSILRKWDWD